MTPDSPRYYLGLDLGQATDYTAAVVLEVDRGRFVPGLPAPLSTYAGRYIHRWPLRTRYTDIVQAVKLLLARPPLTGQTLLVADATGVGVGVVEMLENEGLAPVRVFITAGAQAREVREPDVPPNTWHVPKTDLVSVVAVLLQDQRLKIAAGLETAATLAKELEGFRMRYTAAANVTFGAGSEWRTEQHDDLVLALAVAAWAAERIRPAHVWAMGEGRAEGESWDGLRPLGSEVGWGGF